MVGETFSISESLRFGYAKLKDNLGVSLGLGAATVAVMFVLNGLVQASQRSAGLSFGVSLLSQLVQTLLSFVWLRFALAIYDGHRISARQLMPDGMTFLTYLAVSILYGLMVVVGLFFFILPGLYLAVRYGLSTFIVADRKRDMMAAFHESALLTQGVRWRLFGLGLVLILVNLAGALLFGVGLLLTLPLTAFAAVLVYRRLGERAAHESLLIGTQSPWPV
jgi:uncharacterized membrane protein